MQVPRFELRVQGNRARKSADDPPQLASPVILRLSFSSNLWPHKKRANSSTPPKKSSKVPLAPATQGRRRRPHPSSRPTVRPSRPIPRRPPRPRSATIPRRPAALLQHSRLPPGASRVPHLHVGRGLQPGVPHRRRPERRRRRRFASRSISRASSASPSIAGCC